MVTTVIVDSDGGVDGSFDSEVHGSDAVAALGCEEVLVIVAGRCIIMVIPNQGVACEGVEVSVFLLSHGEVQGDDAVAAA